MWPDLGNKKPNVSISCTKSKIISLYFKSMFPQNSPKGHQIFRVLFYDILPPRTLKYRPIWSHWPYDIVILWCSCQPKTRRPPVRLPAASESSPPRSRACSPSGPASSCSTENRLAESQKKFCYPVLFTPLSLIQATKPAWSLPKCFRTGESSLTAIPPPPCLWFLILALQYLIHKCP